MSTRGVAANGKPSRQPKETRAIFWPFALFQAFGRTQTATPGFPWIVTKPASKLINAWHAGTPALLGPKPAFQALRQSELDYIEVRSPDKVIRAVERLKRDAELYRAMVENGWARGREFTTDAIAARWREVLADPLARGFDRWRRAPAITRLYRPALFAVRAIAHAIEVRRHRCSRDHGLRPVSGQYT